ncbi:piggyBac transposable element-derived protein 4-like [Gastrophryne carolinensis]
MTTVWSKEVYGHHRKISSIAFYLRCIARSGDSDNSAPDLSDVRTWCPIDCGMDEVLPPRFPFTGSPGMKVDVEHNDPLAYLKLFLTDDVIEKIVTETNRYNEQQSATLRSKFSRNRKWEPVTKEDIWKFLGLILLAGVVGKPLQKWYWTTNKLLATPFFGTIMSECRFSLIMKNLHFTNNEEFDEATHPAPKLKKIWEVYQMILKNFQQSYVPDRDISIDESLMAYKGRLSWIQYIASKRARFGIKSYMLCESATGYIWNSVIYTDFMKSPMIRQTKLLSPQFTKIQMNIDKFRELTAERNSCYYGIISELVT